MKLNIIVFQFANTSSKILLLIVISVTSSAMYIKYCKTTNALLFLNYKELLSQLLVAMIVRSLVVVLLGKFEGEI
jgi:hypothetical protein